MVDLEVQCADMDDNSLHLLSEDVRQGDGKVAGIVIGFCCATLDYEGATALRDRLNEILEINA